MEQQQQVKPSFSVAAGCVMSEAIPCLPRCPEIEAGLTPLQQLQGSNSTNEIDVPVLDPKSFEYEKNKHLLPSTHWDTQLWLNLVFLKSLGLFTEEITKALQTALKQESRLDQTQWHRFTVWTQYMALHKHQLESGLVKIKQNDLPRLLTMAEIRDAVEHQTVSYFGRMDFQSPQNSERRPGMTENPALNRLHTISTTADRPDTPSSSIWEGAATTETESRSTVSSSSLRPHSSQGNPEQRNSDPPLPSQKIFKSIPVLHKYQIEPKPPQQRFYSAEEIGFGSIWTTFDGRVAFTDQANTDHYLYFHSPPSALHWDGVIHYLPMTAKLPPYFYPVRIYPSYLPGAVPNSFTEIRNPTPGDFPPIALQSGVIRSSVAGLRFPYLIPDHQFCYRLACQNPIPAASTHVRKETPVCGLMPWNIR